MSGVSGGVDGGSARREDVALLARVARRDETALTELYDRHAPWLSLRLMRRCNDPDLVAETLQDTFLGAWKQAGRWRGDGEVAAWLWGIAIRRLVSGLRKTDRLAIVGAFAPGPPVASAEEVALLSVEYGDVGSALAALSPELRAVIQLCVLDGLTERDTARALGLPVGTAKGRIRKAKRLLAEEFGRSAGLANRTEGWA